MLNGYLSVDNVFNSRKDMLKNFPKRIKERNKDLKIRVVRLKFATVCEKAFGDK